MKKVSIRYFGKMKRAVIYYTFTYFGVNYALVNFGKNEDDIHIIKLKCDFFDGVCVDEKTSIHAVPAAEAVRDAIVNNGRKCDGKHFNVVRDGDVYYVEFTGRTLRMFHPFYTVRSLFFNLVFCLLAYAGGLYVYFTKMKGDWVKFADSFSFEYKIGPYCLIAGFAFLTLLLFYKRITAKGSGNIFSESLCMPFVIVMFFGLAARMSLRIAVILIIAAISAYFVIRVRQIKAMRGRNNRERSLRRLFRAQRTIIYASASLLTAAAILMGAFIPYARNAYASPVRDAVIKKNYTAACEQLSAENWSALSDEEKGDVLQTIVDYEAVMNDTPSAKVITASLNGYWNSGRTYGSFYDDYNIIFVDTDYALDNVSDSVDTVLHEYRHFQQHYYARTGKDENADDFREGIENYTYTSFSEYRANILEADSRWWASLRMNDYIPYISADDFEASEFYKNSEDKFIVRKYCENTEFDYDYAICHPYGNKDDTSEDYVCLTAFCGSGKSTDIVLPDSIDNMPVKEVGPDLFKFVGQTVLSVTIPDGIESIDERAFDRSPELTVKVSSGNKAFSVCDGEMLISNNDGTLLWVDKKASGKIRIPEKVQSIGWNAFAGCGNITDADVDENNKTYASVDGIVYRKDTFAAVFCPEGKTGLAELSDKCTAINEEAFAGCDKISEIIIPPSCKEIADYAFEGCDSLLRLEIPSTVEVLHPRALSGINNLERLSISKNTSFGDTEFGSRSLYIRTETLSDIFFDGSKAEWNKLNIVIYRSVFATGNKNVTVHCTDGELKEEGGRY